MKEFDPSFNSYRTAPMAEVVVGWHAETCTMFHKRSFRPLNQVGHMPKTEPLAFCLKYGSNLLKLQALQRYSSLTP